MTLSRRTASVAVLALAALMLASLPAVAAGRAVPTKWSAVTAKTPAKWPLNSYFVTMSCVTSSDCWASGNTLVNPSPSYSALLERWNGSTWQPSSLGTHQPMEAGGISCAGTTFCVMVGGTAFNGTSTVRIEQLNGTSWHQTSQAAGGGFLDDVVCEAKNWCLAVGWKVSASQTTTRVISELYNGSKWSPVSVPSSSKARTTLLELSCVSETSCVAIGQQFPTADYPRALFSERWNGSKWSVVSIPNPTYPGYSVDAVPNDVSCVGTKCLAVGYYYPVVAGRTTYRPVADSWNGASWKQLSLSTSVMKNFQYFDDVSCVSASSCWVVGAGAAPTENNDASAAYWNGSALSNGSVVRPGLVSQLEGVHCVRAASCYAIGTEIRSSSSTSQTVLAERVAAP